MEKFGDLCYKWPLGIKSNDFNGFAATSGFACGVKVNHSAFMLQLMSCQWLRLRFGATENLLSTDLASVEVQICV